MDTLRSEARPKKRGRVGRYVYLAGLAAFFLVVIDALAGEYIYLRGDGMIAQEVSIVTPGFPGIVEAIEVTEGQEVRVGDIVARTRSQEMLNDLAELSNELAKVQTKLSEMRIRKGNLATLIPAARKRAQTLERYRADIEALGGNGLATTNRQATVISNAFDAMEKLALLEAEQQVVLAELEQAEDAVQRARRALRELEKLYANGVVVATENGVVGTIAVKRGDGFEGDAPIAEIFHGERYVLAYVPIGAIYEVEPGDRVAMRSGFDIRSGEIVEILPVAPRLPIEFQRSFRTIDRAQLVRIRMDGDDDLPLFTKVRIASSSSMRVLLAKLIVGARDLLSGEPAMGD